MWSPITVLLVLIWFSCFRNDFEVAVPDVLEGDHKPTLKPALQIYCQSKRLLLIFNKKRDREKLDKLCRYLIATLESDSPKFSYVGVALNKEHVIQWISHINVILWKCCDYLEELKPEYPDDMKIILLYLHMLVSFTSTNTWVVLRNKNMDVLKSGMNQLCANIMGNLFHKGFYLVLKVKLFY